MDSIKRNYCDSENFSNSSEVALYILSYPIFIALPAVFRSYKQLSIHFFILRTAGLFIAKQNVP